MKRLLIPFLVLLLALAACDSGGTQTPEPPTEEPPPTLPQPTESPLRPPESPLLPPESPSPRPVPPVGGGARDAAVLLVIAPEDFNDEEYFQPRASFEAAGYRVLVASLSQDVATGMFGAKVQPDLALVDVQAADYEAVVFIGGSGARVYWDNELAHRLAREAADQGRVVAAICIAPVILGRARVLEGRRATVFDPESLCPELEAGGAICTGAPVQQDGRIVTAFGPQASEQFAEAIVKALQQP